ncbi:carboxymuconolactone decarboxylase family protein [Microvirga thermotolerans]|uniref:Carboxymuconolactone decarboxylase family protein n=1 Tax=Microvirga thermotolerans TaxID=2651334 RepID=A0A5P9JTK0_9HYPH|nr:carboxymuconolactone decarboxylase family protein [Microvirga thermotolerans]QFU15098.1 carboxymuconolactone decarboxylase family protein [Microvirga thermotolerans]
MKPRLDFSALSPDTMKAMLALEHQARNSGLEQSLIELVKIRASQINGCAYCLHMHTRDARAHGETEERIYLLDAWRESPLYTDRERAALAWTESLTLIARTRAPDEDYALLAAHFTPDEQAKLTLLIVTINGWNRFAVGFRAVHPAGSDRAAA